MEMMEVGLFEKISPPWKRDRDVYQQVEKVGKPRPVRPVRSQKCEFERPRRSDLLQNSRN